MRRASQRPLADAFLWIGLLLLLFGIADLLPSQKSVKAPPSNPSADGRTLDDEANIRNDRLVEGTEQGYGNARHLRSVTSPAATSPVVSAVELTVCKYTRANPKTIADSRGYVCLRSARATNGCCHPEDAESSRYTCDVCDEHHCCNHYEHCVSCCLRPSHSVLRDEVRSHYSFRNYAVRAAFDICVAVCRSGSSSVVHENAYKHARHHCFGLIPPDFDPALHGGVFDFATPVSRPVSRVLPPQH